MAVLNGTTIWEIQTGGDDTNNSGAFDPGTSASMNFDGTSANANTATPTITFGSSGYTFQAGDIGAWLFLGSSPWFPGWYKITAVAGNTVTVNAAIGAAVVARYGTNVNTTTPIFGLNTVVGVASVASPGAATQWAIDYSQQAASAITYSDLSSTGVGLTVSSAAFPFTKVHVGNSINVTGGTNFTPGRYVIASVAAGVATLLGPANVHTGAGTDSNGTGRLGGALASPGKVMGYVTGQNVVFIRRGTYTISTAATNVSNGCMGGAVFSIQFEGYDTVRTDLLPYNAAGVRPTLLASGITAFTMFQLTGNPAAWIRNLILDGANLATSAGIVQGNATLVYNVHAQNFTNGAFGGGEACERCSATGCSGVAPFNTGANALTGCVAWGNTVTGFSGSSGATYVYCISYNNTGASSDGFAAAGLFANCVAYGNGRHGISMTNTDSVAVNCIAESNAGSGINAGSGYQSSALSSAAYGNGTNFNMQAGRPIGVNLVIGTSSFFVNPALGNFTLNGNAGGGALLRGAGYPGTYPGGASATTAPSGIGAAASADGGGGSGSIMLGTTMGMY